MSRKVKWGVLGTAGIFEGCTCPGMLQAENCELYAIAGRNMEKAEKFKEKYGFQKAYGDYEELLNDPEVEAVYVALPNTLHYDWTIKALQKKKHVLCEKPIAPSAEQAEEMFKTAEENGVNLMEAFAYQHSPYISAIKQEIDSGIIGEIKYLDSAFITSDYNLNNIRMRRETLGGCTYDLGVYNTSLTLRLMGEAPMNVKAAGSFTEQGIDNYTTVIMEYKDGSKATLSCGMILATDLDKRIDRLEIQGTKGAIKALEFQFNGEGTLSYEVTTFDGTCEVKEVQVPHNYRLEVEQMGRCITDGEKPAVSAEFSVTNAKIIDEILKEIKY